jgi:hypothetical protein
VHATAAPLIGSSTEITGRWLEQVFAPEDASPISIQINSIEPIGQGNTGEVVRVSLSSDSIDVPASVVCKLGSTPPEARALRRTFGPYQREASCYRHFLRHASCRTPRCYLANVSDDGLGCNLVLEDLSRATRPGNQVAGCSVAEASAAISELALLHRSHWNGNRLNWLIDPTGPFSVLWQQMYTQGASIFRERFADRLDAAHLELIGKLIPRIQEWTAAPSIRKTFVHGDARVDNVLFIDNGQGQTKAVLLDWQLSAFRNPLYDVAYFLTGSISVEDRRQHEKSLLEGYFRLVRDAESGLTFDQIHADYRDQIISGLLTTVFAALSIPAGPQGDALLLALANRNCAAVLDWEWM